MTMRRTDVGRKRKDNEDSLLVNPEQKLFVVADGMGGHAAGEVASRLAVDAINEFVCLTSSDEEITWPFGLEEDISYDGNRLKTAIRYANRKVLDATRQRSEYEGMATTVAAVLVDGDTAHIAHVGDSRIYLWGPGGISLLTSDHSWVNEQIQSGVISPEQARNHPLRNVVTRALGGRADLVVDIQVESAGPFHIISGYRSPETNSLLRMMSKGIARNSLHTEGKAIDIRLPGYDLMTVQRAARDLQMGGVGYYPLYDFVHVDVGSVRYW